MAFFYFIIFISMNKSYSDTLRDPMWQKKRLSILNRDKFSCILCGDKKTELHVHHKVYIKGRKPWEYSDDNFSTYCKYCHEIVESLKTVGQSVMSCNKVLLKNGEYMIIVIGKNRKEISVWIFEMHSNQLELKVLLIPEDINLINNLLTPFKKEATIG